MTSLAMAVDQYTLITNSHCFYVCNGHLYIRVNIDKVWLNVMYNMYQYTRHTIEKLQDNIPLLSYIFK